MLLPALNIARQSAKGIQCAGNLKNLGLAETYYANDYDEHFPRTWELTYGEAAYYPGVQYYDSWLAYLMVYTGDATWEDAQNCPKNPKNVNSVWDCPAIDTCGNGNFAMRYTNYAYNTETASDYLTSKNWPTKPYRWKYPSEILALADAKELESTPGRNSTGFTGTDGGRMGVGANHLNQFNGVFLDGHVKSHKLVLGAYLAGPGLPLEMCVYGYPNQSHANTRIGRILPSLW